MIHCPRTEKISSLVFLEIVETFEVDKRSGLWAYKSWADKSFNDQINFLLEKRLSGKNVDACFKIPYPHFL